MHGCAQLTCWGRVRELKSGEVEDIADVAVPPVKSPSTWLAVKPDRMLADVGGNQERLSALVSPRAMAFTLPLLLIKIWEARAMTKSLIPWHVFHDAIETLNPYSLNFWLERWRFMDGGVVLFEANIPALELTHTIFNLLHETTMVNDRDTANEIIDSPQPTPSANKRIFQ
jgi:hypothetical protein